MTLYFNTAVVKEGGDTPTPVEEDWFEFKLAYDNGFQTYSGYIRPTKKTIDEWIKFYALQSIAHIDGAVLDSYEGDIYNNIGSLVKEDGDDYMFRPYGPYNGEYYSQMYWFKAAYHTADNNEHLIERAIAGMSGECYGEFAKNATCGYIELGYDISFGGYASRSELPDWDINNNPLTWEFDVTWNEDGTFNLTNFKLIYDAEGNRHE